MKTLERKLANKIADHWYNELHMQHKPIFQKQKLADFVECELKTLGLFSVSQRNELLAFTYWAIENIHSNDIVPWKIDEYIKANCR